MIFIKLRKFKIQAKINLLNYSSEKKRVKSFTKKRKTRLELKVINI